MKVLLLCYTEDNGGNGYALKRALDRYTDWEVRCIRRERNFLDHPADYEWRSRSQDQEVRGMFAAADVVMMLGHFEPATMFPGYSSKPKIMYHLGQRFRDNAAAYMARCRAEGIPQLVTTFDLLAYGDDLTWLPMTCDPEMMRKYREAYQAGDRVRVMQTPAARGPNDTDQFASIMKKANLNVELSLIERVPWREALRLKAQADVLFDSFATGYGLSVIEAWAMGIPAVCGTGDEATEQRIIDTFWEFPYLRATPSTVVERIATLAESPKLRREYGEAGRQIVEDFHSDEKVVERLRPIIESVV